MKSDGQATLTFSKNNPIY